MSVHAHRLFLFAFIAAGLPACIDYGFFGNTEEEAGGRKADRPRPRGGDGDATATDTADTGAEGGGSTVPTDTHDSAPPDDPGSCDGYAPPVDYAVPTLSTCRNTTPLYAIAPTLEWSWTANATHPGWDNVLSTPIVAHLTDDDGDGTIGAGDIPDIVLLAQSDNDYLTGEAALTVLDGRSGTAHWSIRDASGERFNPASQPAVGDLNADGQPEICVAGWSSAVVCVDGATGGLVFAAGSETSLFGALSLADLDGDGLGEVVYGRQIFDHQGNTLAVGSAGAGRADFFGYPVYGSVIADWDLDGDQEVVAGNTVYERDGTITWQDGGADGPVAVADLDLDGRPDLVRSGRGTLVAVDNGGNELFSIAIPGGGAGGGPSVADLDQDGVPEILVSGSASVSAVDRSGTVLWSTAISDSSSGALSVSTADLDADGFPEVLQADEGAWRILDGRTGTVLHEDPSHASATAAEYPVVADVDADGEAEILVASNNGYVSGTNGLRVYGSGGTVVWPPAREVWNQHSYCITNIDDDAGLPASPTNSWDLWNNFRAAGQTATRVDWRADLQPGPPDLCLDTCDAGQIEVALSVENEGLVSSLPFSALLLDESGTVVHTESFSGLSPGAATYTAAFTLDQTQWGDGTLTVVIDDADTVSECDETDNTLDLGVWPCE